MTIYSKRYNAPLTEEQQHKLVVLLIDLQQEYETFRKGMSVMESALLYNTRMIIADLEIRP